MVRCTVDLGLAGRLVPAPFVSRDGRAVAWLEIGGATDVCLFGAPADLRGLAAAAMAAAEQAEQMLAIAEQLAAAGIPVGGGG